MMQQIANLQNTKKSQWKLENIYNYEAKKHENNEAVHAMQPSAESEIFRMHHKLKMFLKSLGSGCKNSFLIH